MEFFNNAKAVRLRSHHGKYLVADDDEQTVRQSHDGSSQKARWTVEHVQNNSHLIRLKSRHNKYLAASDEPFLLGMKGKKVVQATPSPSSEQDWCIEWEPITEGFQVKLRVREGKFLRANGGTPPWRNSVTHDVPYRTATQDWVLWDVDVVDILDFESLSNCGSFASSLSNCSSSYSEEYDTGSPLMVSSSGFGNSFARKSAMEIFQKAKLVRLRSHHDKYLSAEEDEEGVCQDRNGSSTNAKWEVEVLENAGCLRLKSYYGKYLSASNMPVFLGLTGKKVLQTLPRRLDSSLEWEPIREGIQVKLKTRYGLYLRANGGVPPWRNSITHDIPHRSATQDWILWDVEVLEFQTPAPSQSPAPAPTLLRTATPQPIKLVERKQQRHNSGPPSPTPISLMPPRNEVDDSLATVQLKDEGRLIIYEVVDDKGNIDKSKGQFSFFFKGTGVEQLKQKLKQETGLDDILVCSENPLNGKLYPIRLHLPPNKAKLNVVVVPSTSTLAKEFNK